MTEPRTDDTTELSITSGGITAAITLPPGWTDAASNPTTRVGLGPMDRTSESNFVTNVVLTVQDHGSQATESGVLFSSVTTIKDGFQALTVISTTAGADELLIEHTATVDLADHSVGLAMSSAATEWRAWADDFDSIVASLTISTTGA